jgi:uncharacterized protein YndB with AHSA1/START domain
MTRFGISIEIPAPPERVWAVMADEERWHEWTSTVTSIERMDKGPLVVGSRARIRQPRLPAAVWEITEVRPGRGFTWMTRSPGVRVVAEHGVEPAGDGSRATLSIRFSGPLGPLVARLTRRLNEEYLAIEANGLRARSTRPA